MTGLTIAQKEQLWNMRRRRTQVANEIETLSQCENRMASIRERAERKASSFQVRSRRDQVNWRGQTGIRYNESRSQARTNIQAYTRQMTEAMQRVSQRRSTLSIELANLNTSIRTLERTVNGGV